MSRLDTISLIIHILVILQLIAMLIDLLFSHFAFKAADKQEYEKAIKLIKIGKTVLLICSPLMFLVLRKDSEELIEIYQKCSQLDKLQDELEEKIDDFKRSYTKYAGDGAEEL